MQLFAHSMLFMLAPQGLGGPSSVPLYSERAFQKPNVPLVQVRSEAMFNSRCPFVRIKRKFGHVHAYSFRTSRF